jgi:hypothetical protein
MSMTFSRSLANDTAAYGGIADAIGGLATVVLAIIGLAGVRPEALIAIAVIVFGVALLIQGGAMLSEFAGTMFPSGSTTMSMQQFGASSLSAVFLAGAALIANEMASGSAGVQSLAGLTAIVLGILAVVGLNQPVLQLSALIVLGAALVLTGSSLSATVMSFMRPATASS